MPVARWRYLRDNIAHMGRVVHAIDCLDQVSGADARHALLCMCATVARQLMLAAADDMDAALALSPDLRAALARADACMAKGGAR
jgi:hypothetical protein